MRERLKDVWTFGLALAAMGLSAGAPAAPATPQPKEASAVASVSNTGTLTATVLLQTHAIATWEAGPEATVAKFGEVYTWSPAFFVVRESQPTPIRIRNLQSDDAHNFELLGPHSRRLARFVVAPRSDASHVFTFHKPGPYRSLCVIHQPEMDGQNLVPPATGLK